MSQGYGLQRNRKTKEGTHYPDRDAQFEPINATLKWFAQPRQLVIAADARKKELVGAFKNGGRNGSRCRL